MRGEIQEFDLLLTTHGWRQVFVPRVTYEARTPRVDPHAMLGRLADAPARQTRRQQYPALFAQDPPVWRRTLPYLVNCR